MGRRKKPEPLPPPPKDVCSRCHRKGLTSECTRKGMSMGRFCANCFDLIDHDEPPRSAWSTDSGRNHNDPGFDNVIRAIEEDR